MPSCRGDAPGIMDVLSGTAGTLSPDRLAMIVKLERDADDIIARRLESAAATEESTPPDIAQTMRVEAGSPARPIASRRWAKKLLRNAHGGIDAGSQTKSKRRMAVIVLF